MSDEERAIDPEVFPNEQKTTQERLRASEERFRLLVQGVRDYAIFLLDPTGHVSTWNEGAERLKGYGAAEILGAHFSRFYPPEEVAAGKCDREIEGARITGRFEDEGWRVRRDGTRFWANMVLTALRNEAGDLIGFAKVTRDLTEPRRAEESLRRSHDELEVRVEQRTRELVEANERLVARERELEEALRGRDEFLAVAAHELRTPITSLKLQVDRLERLMRRGAGSTLDLAAITKSIGSAALGAAALAELVEGLLDISRVRSGQLTLSRSEVDLEQVVRDAVAKLAPPLRAAKCEARLASAGPTIAVVDPIRIGQVIANLLSNVIKYAPGQPVDIGLRAEDTMVRLEVRDHGPGISPENQPIVFERFARGIPATQVSGLGLGLWIARHIVEAHGGTLALHSLPGDGATFTATLPRRLTPPDGASRE